MDDLRDDLELSEIDTARMRLHPPESKDCSEEDMKLSQRQYEIQLNKRLRHKKSIERNINTMNARLKDAQEEATFFLRSYKILEQFEPLKPFDDFDSQAAFWNEKFSEEVNLRGLLGQPVNFELAKSILSLNNNAPIKKQIVNTLECKQKAIIAQLEAQKEQDG